MQSRHHLTLPGRRGQEIRRLVDFFVFVGVSACSPSAPSPCQQDAFECANRRGELQIDADCDLSDALMVRIGQGRESFSELDTGEVPTQHHGPQGGSHMFAAARIENPDPAHAAFQLEFVLASGTAGDDGEPQYVGTDGQPSDEGTIHDQRSILVEDAEIDDDAPYDRPGIVLFLPDEPSPLMLRLAVTDSCGRTASETHPFGP